MVALLPMVAPVAFAAPPAAPGAPVKVFAPLDGRWAGDFVGYDVAGRELYRLHVEQTYRTVDDTTQAVTLLDRDAAGKVVHGEGQNIATRGPDGALALRCLVTKSSGEKVEHVGRVVRAPDGGEALVWSSQAPGRVETFLETVRRRGGEQVYTIQGTGVYQGSVVVMSGVYRRIGGVGGVGDRGSRREAR